MEIVTRVGETHFLPIKIRAYSAKQIVIDLQEKYPNANYRMVKLSDGMWHSARDKEGK